MPLPGLLGWHDGVANIRVQFLDCPTVNFESFSKVHDWQNARQETTMTCARRGDSYLLGFPGVAVFHVCPQKSLIEVFPEESTNEIESVRMLLDQVLPRLLFHKGHVVLHASAVVLFGKAAVAFLGETGRGKSTLAGSFHKSGAGFLTDDCLLIQAIDSGLLAIPAYSSLRLWPDSFDALGYELPTGMSNKLSEGKYRLAIKQRESGLLEAKLAALFVLGSPDDAPVDGRVSCKPLSGSQAMMSLIESAFVLDPVSVDAARQNFSLLGMLSKQDTPIYSLNYERNHTLLPQVRATVNSLCSNQSSPTAVFFEGN